MADAWLYLLTGGALVLLGFAAAQVFDRFRFPDFFILISVGLLIGSVAIPYAISAGLISPAQDPRLSLQTIAPILTKVALAFILFEGGLVLHVRRLGKMWAGALGHTLAAMALAIAGVVLAGTVLLGLSLTTSLVMALAFCGPSASIDISMLSQLRASERTKFTIVVEGVMGNIVAAVFVLLFIQVSGLSTGPSELLSYLLYLGATVLVAYGTAEAWALMIRSRTRRFTFMTSVAIALVLFAVSDGFLGGNGGIAAFVFGLVLGHRQLSARSGPAASKGLQEFHRELVFLLRTFFFVYLGIRVTLTGITWLAILGAAALVAVFVASRWPSTVVLSRAWRLPAIDSRILRATVSRGMTDAVLILFAIEVGYIPAGEAQLATNLLFLVIIGAALTSAILVFRAERLALRRAPAIPAPAESPAPPPTRPPARDLERALAEFLEDPVVRQGEID